MEDNLTKELQALTQLVSYQLAINILPFEKKYSEFIHYGLKQVVKTSKCRVCLFFTNEPVGDAISDSCENCNFHRTSENKHNCNCLLSNEEKFVVIQVQTIRQSFGYIVLNNPLNIKPSIIASIRNFANVIAINIENKLQKDLLEEQNKELSEFKNQLIQFNSQIINSAQEGIIVYDRNLKYQVWNPFMENLSGLSSSEVIGHHVLDVFPFLKDLGITGNLEKALKGEKSNGVDYPYNVPATGRAGWASDTSAPLLNSKKEIIGVISIVRDITARRQAEEMLALEKRRLASIIEGTNVGTWEWNIQTGETVFNERWANIIGYTLEELFPTSIDTWTKYCHPEDLKISGELLEKHFKGELDYYRYELRMKHKNGDWTWILDRGKVHKWDENGKPLLMSGTHQDISERKRSEDELKYRMTELTNTHKQLDKYISDNKELEQFVYISSHQLQQPIRTIKNFINVLNEDYGKLFDDNATMLLNTIKDSAERMNSYIFALSEYSRLGLHGNFQRVDINKIISNVITDLQSIIEPSFTTIEVSEMPVINIYADELRQVFQNLISNAIKYQKKNNYPEIKIQAEQINDNWKFSISDNGIGIPDDQLKNVFNIFQRLQIDENEYEGKGVGLAVCKKIIELHHGKIWIESALGQGTTVNFTIPELIL